jgi:hypothetical protein
MLSDVLGYPLVDSLPVRQSNLPSSSLGYSTNNIYPGFPPKTADGRNIIASHQPEAVLNNNLVEQYNIKSNWEYRQFLIENSQEIIRQNFNEAATDVGYTERYVPQNMAKLSTPFQYNSYLDNSRPTGFNESDLKSAYLSREQLNSRKFAPAITQQELMSRLNL